jgi:hypothetical protein
MADQRGPVRYQTVLPDGVTQEMADAAFREGLYARRDARAQAATGPNQTEQRVPAPAAATPPVDPKKEMNNKPLIIGLLVIVAILVIIITHQIIKSREADAAAAALAQQQTGQPPGQYPPQQPQGQAQGQQQYAQQPRSLRNTVGERVVGQMAAKGKALAGRVADRQPSRGTLGRQTANDRQQLDAIVEAAEEDAGDQQSGEEVRSMVARALQEQEEETPMEPGTALIVGADAAARDELVREHMPEPVVVRNDRLIEHRPLSEETDEGDGGGEAAADEQNADPVPCPAILASGRRSGQICGRRCPPGQTMCSMHKK